MYEEKIKELENSKFLHFYSEEVKGLKFKLSWKKLPEGGVGTHSFTEPSEEIIKSYILPFRFFIQKNEKCSIRHLGEQIIPKLENDFSEQTNEFKKIRDAINSFLNSSPGLKLKFQWSSEQLEFQSNNDIKNCFIYGHYAHAEEKNNQKRWYDLIHRNINEGFNSISRSLFRFEAITIILQLTEFFVGISKLFKIILDKVIDYYLKEGKKARTENNLDKGLRLYKNVLYIAEKLGKKEIRSDLYKKISEIYGVLGDTKLSGAYLDKYKEILFSVQHLPENFKDNMYYAEYFSVSDEYREIIEKILQKPYNFSDFPIVVIPIERIFDAKKFEKMIYQRNFQVAQKNERIRLIYDQYMSENHFTPQKFEFSLNKGYICKFPFIDDSGILIITNSKELFAEHFSIWIELRNLLQKFPMFYVKLMRLIHYLINIEMDNTIEINKIETLIKLDSDKEVFELKNPSAINFQFQGFRNIIMTIIKISTYPRIKKYIKIKELMENLRINGIEPHINKECKGQELFSICLNIILYTSCLGDEKYLNYPYLKDLNNLLKICNLIKGKSLNEEFFIQFIQFCYNYIISLVS